jgi:hypothetical protein
MITECLGQGVSARYAPVQHSKRDPQIVCSSEPSHLDGPAAALRLSGGQVEGLEELRQLQAQHPLHNVHVAVDHLSDAVLHLRKQQANSRPTYDWLAASGCNCLQACTNCCWPSP